MPVDTFVEEAKKKYLPILATTLSQNLKITASLLD